MKKAKFIVGLMAAFLLVGCGQVEQKSQESFDIVTSFYPIYIFTKNIAKDIPNVNVTNMANSHRGCLHDYHLDIKSMKQIEEAEVFIINGAGMETFMEKVYDREGLEVIDSSENIELLQNKFNDSNNEHIWLSISDAIKQVENIGNGLAKLDKDNESKYLENTYEYVERLKALKNELRESLYSNDKEIKIVTAHDAFPYFAKDFEFEVVDVIEKEEGESPAPKEMKEIIKNIKDNGVCGVFIESDYSDKLANTIADEAGVKAYILDSVTSGDDSLEDYENKMKNNITVIRESLK